MDVCPNRGGEGGGGAPAKFWSNYNDFVATWSKTDKSWKKVCFPYKNLILEMPPIGMIQETQKQKKMK